MKSIITSFSYEVSHNKKILRFGRYICNSSILTLFFYVLLFVILGITNSYQTAPHITKIRVFKSMLLYLVFLSILQSICPLKFCIKKRYLINKYCLSLVIPISIITIYTYIFIRAKGTLDRIGYYYDLSILLFFMSFIVLMLISYLPKGKLIASFFYTLLSFILFIPSVIYLGYYQIYHSFIREIGLLSILATTKSEIINYLTANFSINQIYIAIIGIIVLFFLFFYISYHTARQKCILAIPKKYVFILFIFSCIIFGHVQLHIFPINEYITMHKTNGIIQAYMALRDNIDNNSNEIRIPENAMNTAVKTPGTILIVIGESANRDRMSAFNPSYPENTTPWEATETTNPDFFFPSHAYSNYPNTVMALTQALTNVNQYENEIKLGDSVNIIDVAKKMGYHTYWISTQGKNGIYDGGVTLIAKRAEKAIWNNNKGADDQWLVEQLKLVPKNQNNFIVLHMTGSHFRYSNRYPSSFGEKQIFNSSNNKEYDTSLAYTDTILHSIYEYAQQNLQLQAMVYMSDHGENMKYTHVTNPFYYDMIRIPLWFYLSPQYQTAYPETVQSLRAHRHTVFTNDLLFDTISGLLHSNSNFYLPQNDFTNSKYDLTLKNAKSVNGTIDIADDPGITPAK